MGLPFVSTPPGLAVEKGGARRGLASLGPASGASPARLPERGNDIVTVQELMVRHRDVTTTTIQAT
jgi:hypothetical protein